MSKLTNDLLVNDIFSRYYFAIQDTQTNKILAKGKHKDGIYILSFDHQAFLASTIPSSKALFETWHQRLGHVAFDIISHLNKNCCLVVTSLLLKPVICSSCQLSK